LRAGTDVSAGNVYQEGPVRHRSVNATPGRSGRLSILVILGLAFLSVTMTYLGMTTLQEQRSGVPARMTVEKCSTDMVETCWGVWPRTVGGTASKIEIQGTSSRDVSRQIGVHVHDNRSAVADASPYPIYEVGMGLAFAIVAVAVVMLRRQQRVTTNGSGSDLLTEAGPLPCRIPR
jgi:hypothetical protein